MHDVLLVVDVQRGFINEHTQHVVPKIERAQGAFDRVIATRYYREASSQINRLLSIEGFAQGSPDTELAFAVRDDATVIEKCSYSCIDDRLAEKLQQNHIDTVHICGIDTDQCVMMTAGTLMEKGIRPVVFSDLTASAAGPTYHESALLLLRRLIGNEQVQAFFQSGRSF